ncbi:MAG: hypothetical protein P1P84_05650 [Deferrisomatales bacterium]|nr:hypothetical protein [Deferrisomatales bacterium]
MGRWVLEAGDQDVFMNSAGAEHGDFLMPEPSGQWHLLTGDGQRDSGAVSRGQVPDDLEAESVRTIGDRLKDLTLKGASWFEWIEVIPLVPGISEQVDLQPLEILVREQFGHLEAACLKPRAHLHVEVERVPVPKARRVPPAAVSYLAAHTEDWDRPLLRGILPKRILAEVRYDQVDIYENRVVARLLDNLGAYLNRRIRVLRRLLKVFQEKEDYSASVAGTYQREHRISELWGKSIDANEGRRKAEAALRELEWLKYKVMGLLGSPLYEDVPRRAYVPTTLKSTNILTNDQHYRRIADLWREWARTGAGRTQSPSELHAEAQRLCRGLDSFVMLLTVRALHTLGYEPSDTALEMPLAPGGLLSLRGDSVDVTLSWRDDGTTCIAFGERELTIVALISNLGAGADERVRESLDRIRQAASERERGDVLVLFLASDDERSSADLELLTSLHTVGNDPRNMLAGGGCLPVSPWEIGSTERVARALRWFLSGARLGDYPLRVNVPPDVRDLINLEEHARWLSSQDGGNTLELHTPPHDFEWESLNVAAMVQAAEADLRTARSNHRRLNDELRNAVRQRKTGSLVRQKHDAHEEVLQCETVEQAAHALAERLRDAHARSIALLSCPTCAVNADPARDFKPLDRGCFCCECHGCGTQWGTRLCGEGHRYAVMLPSGDFLETNDQRPGWEDRVYGCDILALPARKQDGQWGFACPECGQVS